MQQYLCLVGSGIFFFPFSGRVYRGLLGNIVGKFIVLLDYHLEFSLSVYKSIINETKLDKFFSHLD